MCYFSPRKFLVKYTQVHSSYRVRQKKVSLVDMCGHVHCMQAWWMWWVFFGWKIIFNLYIKIQKYNLFKYVHKYSLYLREKWKKSFFFENLYLCVCVSVYVYFDVRHLGTLVLRSSNNILFKNIAHYMSISKLTQTVFVYLYLCIWAPIY